MSKKKRPSKPLSKAATKKLIKRLSNKADRVLSEYVRLVTKGNYGLCPLCGVKPVQCCFHFISRRRKVLRWDIRNVTGACNTCNFVERHWPDLSRAWFIKTFGVDLYLSLAEESRKPFEPSQGYLEKIIAEYTTKLELMKPKL